MIFYSIQSSARGYNFINHPVCEYALGFTRTLAVLGFLIGLESPFTFNPTYEEIRGYKPLLHYRIKF